MPNAAGSRPLQGSFGVCCCKFLAGSVMFESAAILVYTRARCRLQEDVRAPRVRLLGSDQLPDSL